MLVNHSARAIHYHCQGFHQAESSFISAKESSKNDVFKDWKSYDKFGLVSHDWLGATALTQGTWRSLSIIVSSSPGEMGGIKFSNLGELFLESLVGEKSIWGRTQYRRTLVGISWVGMKLNYCIKKKLVLFCVFLT